MQCETLRQIYQKEGGRHLIICPLGVRQELKRDGLMLGIEFKFVRKSEEVMEDGFYLTNYESVRDGKLDVNLFVGISLDEASVLRSYGSETYQTFLSIFGGVKYRFVATATPSPNRYKELIHYAGFLGVMDTGQALTRFFQRDSSQANNLTLYPHMEQEFFTWLHSWAIFLQRPSDLGYSDEGYALPKLNVIYHEVKVTELKGGFERDGQGKMFRDAALGLKDAATEKRESIDIRVAKCKEIIDTSPEDHFILWHDLEAERHGLKKAIPECVEVFGSLELEEREERIIDFSNGKYRLLATKPEISGSGCNFQRHCHKAIFLGIGYKFNDFIQSIHRIHRFLQNEQVEIHIIYTETEREILSALQEKWKNHEVLADKMSQIINEFGLNTTGLESRLERSIGLERKTSSGQGWEVVNNDCVLEAELQSENSVGLIVTSIPFSNHYEYTPSYNDFGHTENNANFWAQMDYLTPHLLRILQPGRIYCCHVKDRILFGNVTGAGAPTVSPFHAEATFHGIKHGFDYMGVITVVTDVVRENNQTYRLGWTENCKDGTKMGVGSPEYILLFRKPQTDRTRGYADNPVVKSKQEYTRARWQTDAHAFWRSSGNRLLTVDELSEMGPDILASLFTKQSLEQVYDHDDHIKIGEELEARDSLPSTFMAIAPGSHDDNVWHDVNRMLTLNGEQSRRNVQLHVCPLQLDIVERLIRRYSNEGDLVYDPFGGLGTVPFKAVKMRRRGKSSELNTGYWKDSIGYLRAAEREMSVPDLFGFLDEQVKETV